MKILSITLVAALTLIGCKPGDSAQKGAKAPEQNAPATGEKAAAETPAPATNSPAQPAPAAGEAKAPATTATATTANADGQTAKPAGCGGAGANGVKPAGCGGAKTAGCGGATADGAKPAKGCGQVAGTAAPKPSDSNAVKHFGAAFKATTTQGLDNVLANADKHNGKVVKVTARISKVCKKKGCWFILAGDKGDGAFVRVTMLNYGFFVPTDCDGKTAVVEGTFTKKDVPEAARKHLAEDGGDNAKNIKGATVELRLVATAIDIKG